MLLIDSTDCYTCHICRLAWIEARDYDVLMKGTSDYINMLQVLAPKFYVYINVIFQS